MVAWPDDVIVGQPHYQPLHTTAAGGGAALRSSFTSTEAGTTPVCINNHQLQSPVPCTLNFQYFGGDVIANVKVYAVFWTSAVSSEIQSGMPGFYSTIVDSAWVDWLSEYSTNLSTQAGTHAGQAGTQQMIGRGVFAGTYTLTALSKTFPACPAPNATLTCLADGDIANEIDFQVSQGQLPPPDADTLYVIHFPASIRISNPNQVSCQTFCSYHGVYQNAAKQSVYYVVAPDLSANGCETGCGSGSTFDNTCAATSHEVAESITDGQAGLANGPDFPLAWYDNEANSQGEIGDVCQGHLDTVGTGGLTGCAAGSAGCYIVQQLFSNVVWSGNPASQPNVAACVGSRYDSNDYSIALSTKSISLGPGASSQPIPVLTAPTSGEPIAITLSVTALPTGVHATIDVPSLSVGGGANLTVSADPSAAPLQDGVLVVQATGTSVHSAALLVQVDSAPTVAITSPAAGATVTGLSNVTVAARPGSNTVLSGISIAIDGSAPLSTGTANSVSWNTHNILDGSHTIHATVVDADGGQATASLSVVVSNGGSGNTGRDGGGVVGGCSSVEGEGTPLALLVLLTWNEVRKRRRTAPRPSRRCA